MPTSDAPLTIGIIGAGIMAERLLGAIHGATDSPVRVAAIWDPAPAALDRIGAAFPAVPRVADSAAVVAASDCVYVASPPASHLGYARAALAAGRSVFCEKPLAIDRADARAFVAEKVEHMAKTRAVAVNDERAGVVLRQCEAGAVGVVAVETVKHGRQHGARHPRQSVEQRRVPRAAHVQAHIPRGETALSMSLALSLGLCLGCCGRLGLRLWLVWENRLLLPHRLHFAALLTARERWASSGSPH